MHAKVLLRKIAPTPVVRWYHQFRARTAAIQAGLPARKLMVIGVTGTKGKSTTVAMLSHCFTALGERVAFSSTVQWGLLGKTWPNRSKMTTPGLGELQAFLNRAVQAGCTMAILEISSEGLAQGRHLGITFDGAVFLNLTPEHIESHGSFRNYRAAKEKLFGSLNRPWRKSFNGKKIPTVIVANVDDANAFSFLRHAADIHVGFTTRPNDVKEVPGLVIDRTRNVVSTASTSTFHFNDEVVHLPLLGAFNVENASATLSTVKAFDYDVAVAAKALEKFPGVPGRMEEVKLDAPFRVFVDYSHEPASLQAAYAAVQLLHPKHFLTLLGAQGGGRDHAKRSVMGTLAAEHADVVVISNEDPYDEDPQKIVDDVALAAEQIEKAKVFRIVDRCEGLQKLLQLAQPGDVVLVTGKGGEEVMAVAKGQLIPWDDRVVIREVWQSLSKSS